MLDSGLKERFFIVLELGAFNSHFTFLGSLSWTVESGCCISCSKTFAGFMGINADLTTSISSSSECSDAELWSTVECILVSCAFSGNWGCGLLPWLLQTGDILTLNCSKGFGIGGLKPTEKEGAFAKSCGNCGIDPGKKLLVWWKGGSGGAGGDCI